MKHSEITDKILNGFYEVYNELGDGFLESVYEKALLIVFAGYGLEVTKQKYLPVYFRNNLVGEFKADIFVNAI